MSATKRPPTRAALLKALKVVSAAVDALPIEAYAEATTSLWQLERILNRNDEQGGGR